MKLRIKSMIWNIRKQKITNQNKKEKEFKKNEESISRLWDYFKHSNICIIGVPEGEQGEQESESLLEKIMQENLPNLVKEVDM